ncbi:MAG: aminotransferase class I/II-fold pyridoxal phosphate-dependent enzyme [Alphaproteobacteria bacterium]|nr:aminotransferase class I/II-fold pyridoxal phosphate-dependent enzyme [Alphaproteobacteria bacterium]
MDVMDRANSLARSGRAIFHLETGQPATKAPKIALEAVVRAMDSDVLGYTEALGRPALRARISKYYRDTYRVDVPPERILITTGSSAGFLLAFIALFDVGQSLAMAVPGYPAYRNIAVATGVRPHFIDCRDRSQFRFRASDIAAAQGISGVLIASPANPSGTVIAEPELQKIVDVCDERKLWLISDEIYHGITYEHRAQTALAISSNVIVINSFSKYFSMTGWRIGWMVVPEALVRPLERLAQNMYISPPTISQIAALAALDAAGELDGHVRAYAANRLRLLSALKESNFGEIAPADGAFYLYADISPFGLDATSFTKRLLDETGVAATPGLDFDPVEGHRWVRFSYAGAQDEISRAADILTQWCRNLRT